MTSALRVNRISSFLKKGSLGSHRLKGVVVGPSPSIRQGRVPKMPASFKRTHLPSSRKTSMWSSGTAPSARWGKETIKLPLRQITSTIALTIVWAVGG